MTWNSDRWSSFTTRLDMAGWVDPPAWASFRAADVLSGTRTTATLAVNGAVSSAVDYAGDTDWFKVSLTAGHRYTFDLSGQDSSSGTLSDPLIQSLYTSAGRAISGTRDDDSGIGHDAQMSWTVTQTGTYYISAAAYGSATGTYRLTLTDLSADTVAPTLVSHTPQTDAVSVSRGADLVLQFSETVHAGSGVITLTGGGQTLQIQISDTTQVSFSGNTLTINPSADLSANTHYEVSLGAGTVLDLAGNACASSGVVAQFTTEAAVDPGTPVHSSWTVMVYMAADNNLEPYAILDLNEMEAAQASSAIQTVALMDRIAGYDSSAGNWTGTRMGEVIGDGGSTSVASLPSSTAIGELNTGDPATLTRFIDWTVANHPADHYALVIWDHGGGLSGAAWDDTSSDNLTLQEIASGLQHSTLDGLDVLAFDACLMGMVEVATEFRGVADYLVASEELVPGEGFAYDNLLNALAAHTDATALNVVTDMLNTYQSEYAGQTDITLSGVDLSKMDALNAALETFAGVAVGAMNNRTYLTTTRSIARATVDMPSDGSYDYMDLRDFMTRMAASSLPQNVRTAATNVVTALDNAVLGEVGTVSAAGGLSIYLPFGTDWVDPGYNAAHYAFAAAAPHWDDFLAVI